jgi:hypothetical protein
MVFPDSLCTCAASSEKQSQQAHRGRRNLNNTSLERRVRHAMASFTEFSGSRALAAEPKCMREARPLHVQRRLPFLASEASVELQMATADASCAS